MRIAYFTAGTIGAGHLVRGIGVGRALARAGVRAEYRMFGPRLPFAAATRADYSTIEVRPDELRDPRAAPSSTLAGALEAFAPDLLLVDMFWAPLRRLLPLRACESWLLVRRCPPQWFAGPAGLPFAPSQFRRIIGIEPIEHPALHEVIAPVVVCNPDECRPRGALRERLGVPDGRRLVVIAHAGLPEEMARLDPGLDADGPGAPPFVHRFDLFDPQAPFPLAEWLGGADAVVCASGYNAFWEARWLGWLERTRFTAFARQIDDQAWRLAHCARHEMRENGADVLARRIRG